MPQYRKLIITSGGLNGGPRRVVLRSPAMSGVDAARVIIEVTAGVIPGQPDPAYTRRFVLTSTQWEADPDKQMELLADLNGRAQGYSGLLMLQPDRLNEVGMTWLWL